MLQRLLKDMMRREINSNILSNYISASEVGLGVRRYRWWHQKLADYFLQSKDFERKMQML